MPTRPPSHRPPGYQATRAAHAEAAREHERRRASACQRGYDRRWRKYTLQFLRRNPLCVHCQHAAATQVDHITPITGQDDPLFWVASNHQALCASCHAAKTARDMARGLTR